MNAGRELDAMIEERIFGHPIAGWADDMGDGIVDWRGESRPVYLQRCCCEMVRESSEKVIAACVKEYGWEKAEVEQARADKAAEWKYGHSWQCMKLVPRYSTDISAAWEVLEAMRERKWGEWLTVGVVPQPTGSDPQYEVVGIPEEMHCDDSGGFFRKPKYLPTGFPDYEGVDGTIAVIAQAATAPLAICLAALKAVGAEVPA